MHEMPGQEAETASWVDASGHVWNEVSAQVRTRIGDASFDAWVAPLKASLTREALVVEAPDPTTHRWVGDHAAGTIQEALAATLGRPWPMRLELAQAPPALPLRPATPSPEHTFETFVVGSSNARASAEARTRASGDRRPLFLHGPVGVGKTHLLHAIFHALAAQGTRGACLPAAQLVTDMLAAYRSRGHDAFWHDVGQLDALLLDDVHSLAGQEAVQERLLEGMVTWVAAGRLLVLTSDRAPQEPSALAGRFRERFEDGVIARIDRPEPALRLAIVRHKAALLGLPLDSALAARIAARIGGSVRRLEGALTKLNAHARLLGRRIDSSLAEQALPELCGRPPAPPTVERIIEATAAAFGAAARGLVGRSRRASLVLPRQVAMYLARRLRPRSLGDLARAFGRDQSTVLHACRSVDARIRHDATLARVVERIEQRFDDAGST